MNHVLKFLQLPTECEAQQVPELLNVCFISVVRFQARIELKNKPCLQRGTKP